MTASLLRLRGGGMLDSLFAFRRLSGARPTAPDHELVEVERLAGTAPHLLADIGFIKDNCQSAPQRHVWSRGNIQVTLFEDCPGIEVKLLG